MKKDANRPRICSDELDPKNQLHWWQIIDECAYKIEHICQSNEINVSTFRGWLRYENASKPSLKYSKKVLDIMDRMKKEKAMKKHPSFGYATEDEIKQLNAMGIGPDRDLLLKRIAGRNKKKGKRL